MISFFPTPEAFDEEKSALSADVCEYNPTRENIDPSSVGENGDSVGG